MVQQASGNPSPTAPYMGLTYYPHKTLREAQATGHSGYPHKGLQATGHSGYPHKTFQHVKLLDHQATGHSSYPHKHPKATGHSSYPHKRPWVPSNWTIIANTTQESVILRKPYSSSTSSVKKDIRVSPERQLGLRHLKGATHLPNLQGA